MIVIALDTVRADRLGPYGYERAHTPNLDALARAGCVFENVQSPSPWTAPALISLMTSLEPGVHQVRSFPNPGVMDERVSTLAEILQRRGYDTAAFTEGGYAKPEFGLGQGFDVYPSMDGDETSHTSNLEHGSRVFANITRSIDWLAERKQRPFFLFFHSYEAHGPYRAQERFLRKLRPDYDEAEFRAHVKRVLETWNSERSLDAAGADALTRAHLQWGLASLEPAAQEEDGLRRRIGELDTQRGGGVGAKRPEHVQYARDLYDACIAHLDEQLGRLLEEVQRLGLAERTLVVVVSDHGESFDEHGVLGHGTQLHQELMRVALILRGPGVTAGRMARQVRTIDIMPTVLELLRVPMRSLTLQGHSVASIWNPESGDAALPDLPALGGNRSMTGKEDGAHSLRLDGWSLIVEESPASARLYDLRQDPLEQVDLASTQPERVERMRAVLAARLAENEHLRANLGAKARGMKLSPSAERELGRLGYVEVHGSTAPATKQ